MIMIKRLAQIAAELEKDGLENEAIMLDDAVEQLQAKPEANTPTQPSESVLDVLAQFVQNIIEGGGIESPEQIKNPENAPAINSAINKAVSM